MVSQGRVNTLGDDGAIPHDERAERELGLVGVPDREVDRLLDQLVRGPTVLPADARKIRDPATPARPVRS
jgi:hypothetical protein